MNVLRRLFDRTSRTQEKACTRCGSCLPCPQGIDIPEVMGVILELKAGGDLEEMREKYLRIESPRADECMFCGGCESNCTQGLPIVEDMQNGRRLLEDS